MPSPHLEIQLSLEAGDWPDEDSLGLAADKALGCAARYIHEKSGQAFPPEPVEVSLLFTDDASMQVINAEWRDQDKPTNVLSFPAWPIKPGDKPGPMLGDIILASQTVRREAVEMGKPFDDHLTHLLVHGFLHLFGYDHMQDEQAAVMEGLETGILAELGVSDPYGQDEPI